MKAPATDIENADLQVHTGESGGLRVIRAAGQQATPGVDVHQVEAAPYPKSVRGRQHCRAAQTDHAASHSARHTAVEQQLCGSDLVEVDGEHVRAAGTLAQFHAQWQAGAAGLGEWSRQGRGQANEIGIEADGCNLVAHADGAAPGRLAVQETKRAMLPYAAYPLEVQRAGNARGNAAVRLIGRLEG